MSDAFLRFTLASTERVEWAVRPGIGRWWLPYNYAKHGHSMDALFTWIFWICAIVFVLTQIALIYFLVKYRSRAATRAKKAVFLHGNTKLEMVWTLIPAIILAVVALASKGVWDRYRYAEDYDNTPQTEVLVIAEQFQWNFVYPGKDKQFGQYLAYPKPSDPPYRNKPFVEAMSKINKDILENPLGQNKQFDDPEARYGQDDDYDVNPGRPLILPINRPIAIRLSSKDVIHDFYMPNFRVKLDALPGMQGRLNFTAEDGAKSTEELAIDDPKLVGKPIWLDSATPNVQYVGSSDASQVVYSLNNKSGAIIAKSRDPLSREMISALKANGVTKVTAVTRPFELVCEELCGPGHYKMRGEVYFISGAEYDRFIAKDAPTSNPGNTKVTSAQ